MIRLASVSVDLDSLKCYYRIHGLGEPPPELERVVLQRALGRFAELFARHQVKATFFVIGEDVEHDPSSRAELSALAKAGHELANHSYSHPYDLASQSREFVEDEITRAHQIIAEISGSAPVGFRAPGYDVSKTIFDVLMKLGYRYDSSVFPSWPYYVAKLGMMAAMRLFGQRSRSALTNPRALLAPAMPYRPGASPFVRGQSMLVELPVAVTPGLRLPVIGTSLLLAPTAARVRLLESMRKRAFFNLELHGIDLIGADEDGIPTELVQKQPDLRVSLQHKQRALEATLDRMAPDYIIQPLCKIATRVQREGLAKAQ